MEKVMVRFGSLDERYVGQAARAGVQVKSDLTIHVIFSYPLFEPGITQSLPADEVKDRADQVSDEAEKVMDDAQPVLKKLHGYDTATMVGREPYPLVSMAEPNVVVLKVYWKLTPEQETVDTFDMTKLPELKQAVQDYLTKKGFIITNFDASGR